MKKLLSLVLSFALVCTLISGVARRGEEETRATSLWTPLKRPSA